MHSLFHHDEQSSKWTGVFLMILRERECHPLLSQSCPAGTDMWTSLLLLLYW
jgi:hypothetical protein